MQAAGGATHELEQKRAVRAKAMRSGISSPRLTAVDQGGLNMNPESGSVCTATHTKTHGGDERTPDSVDGLMPEWSVDRAREGSSDAAVGKREALIALAGSRYAMPETEVGGHELGRCSVRNQRCDCLRSTRARPSWTPIPALGGFGHTWAQMPDAGPLTFRWSVGPQAESTLWRLPAGPGSMASTRSPAGGSSPFG